MGCVKSKSKSSSKSRTETENSSCHKSESEVVLRDAVEEEEEATESDENNQEMGKDVSIKYPINTNSITNENFTLKDEIDMELQSKSSIWKSRSTRDSKSKSLPRTPLGSLRERNKSMTALEEPKTKVTLRKKLSGLLNRNTNSLNCENLTYRPQMSVDELTKETMEMWTVPNTGFDNLLRSCAGRKLFDEFLKKEFSRENLQFWIACENLKSVKEDKEFNLQVDVIFKIYILPTAHDEVSLEGRVKDQLLRKRGKPTRDIFNEAQTKIYSLMHRDSFPRFLNSPLFKEKQAEVEGKKDVTDCSIVRDTNEDTETEERKVDEKSSIPSLSDKLNEDTDAMMVFAEVDLND